MPILDDDAFERTKRTVLRDEMRYADPTKEGKRRERFPAGNRFRHGFLDSDLAAPAGPLGAAASCSVRWFKRQSSDDTLVDQELTFTALNFDESLTLSEGTYVKCEWIDGAWEIYWAGCSPQYTLFKTESLGDLLTESGEDIILE